MVWKQDLAKLRQELGHPPQPGPLKAPPKPQPKPGGIQSLPEEDAVFLAAMGLKPARPEPALQPATPVAPPLPVPASFAAAMEDLKGLKPLARASLPEVPSEPPTPQVPVIAPLPLPQPQPEEVRLPLPEPVQEGPPPVLEPAPTPALPVRFQLAAGMALEVDGVLDLRGHCRTDAIERLKDRLGDGAFLGWRTLQVMLGSAPELHEGLLDLLATGQAPMVTRYAQAPVPMGGSQAWLLYFGPPTAQP